VLLALVVMESINAMKPVWTRRRAAVRLIVDLCALAVICALLVVAFEGGLITIAGPNLTAEIVRRGVRWINLSWSVTLGVVALAFIAHIVQDARRATGRMPTGNFAVRFLTGRG